MVRVVADQTTAALRRHSDTLVELVGLLGGRSIQPSWVTGWLSAMFRVWRQVFGQDLPPSPALLPRRLGRGSLRKAREDIVQAVWDRADALEELREVCALDPEQSIRDLGLATARLMRETTHAGETAHDQRPHHYPLRDPRAEPEHSALVTAEVG